MSDRVRPRPPARPLARPPAHHADVFDALKSGFLDAFVEVWTSALIEARKCGAADDLRCAGPLGVAADDMAQSTSGGVFRVSGIKRVRVSETFLRFGLQRLGKSAEDFRARARAKPRFRINGWLNAGFRHAGCFAQGGDKLGGA